MLTRRIPLQPPAQPPSAIPSHIQHRVSSVPPRPRSPQIQLPSSRPGSPFKPRVTQATSPHPQSPTLPQHPISPQVGRHDLEIDVVVNSIPYDHIIAVSIDNTQSNVTPQIHYSHVNYVRRPHHRSKNRLRGVYPSWTQTSPITSHSLRVLISRPSGLSAS